MLHHPYFRRVMANTACQSAAARTRRYNGGMALPFLLMAVAIGSGIVILKRIMDPFEAASRRQSRPAQFTMADFLSLFFLLQIPMAAIHALPGDVPRGAKVTLDCFAWVVCGLLWGSGVKKLANSGVERPRHRLIFLALVLPASFFGTLVFIFAGIACIACFFEALGTGLWGPGLLLVELALLVVFRLSANFVRRMVAAAEAPPRGIDTQSVDRHAHESAARSGH